MLSDALDARTRLVLLGLAAVAALVPALNLWLAPGHPLHVSSFTVALFVAAVAFPPGEVQDAAKMGALFSFLAAVVALVAGLVTRVEKRHE